MNGGRWRIWNNEHIYAGPANGDYPRAVPDGVHTFGHFISAKEFATTHPEYFSMDADGKRMTNDMGNRQLWIQLCVTNEDVRRITLERAKKMLRDDEVEAKKSDRAPARMVVLSQSDNTANLCLCPNCKAISDREGSESGALLDYVNHVACGLKAEFPDVTVQTEVYNFTLAPPRTIRPEANVMIRYCDKTSQETIAPLIEPGLQLLEKLQAADTDSTRTAIATTEAEITHDGHLSEPIWQQARWLRLLPRDPNTPNDDNSMFRFAWTPEALCVAIEQPTATAAAIWEVSLMTPDRKGVQVALHAQRSGSVAAYFYAYPTTGMIAVPGRKSLSKFVSFKTATHVTAEFRIPWTDLPRKRNPTTNY